MAHFAEIDNDGIVQQVIVVNNSEAPDPAPENSEPTGKAFIASIGLSGNWIQTSYNGSFRVRYAGIGMKYDTDLDAFIFPQPYPSWTLDSNYEWQPPVPMPTDGGPWLWDEGTQSWVEWPN